MQCPKCGFDQPESDECRSCGIVIEKFIKKSVSAPRISEKITGADNQSKDDVSYKTAIISLIAIVFVVYAGVNYWKNRPVSYPPGEIVADTPEQSEASRGLFDFKDYRILPLADFRVAARVLSKKKYYFGRESDLAPIDLALGWGPMSDEAVLEKIKIRQSNRFYFWSAEQFPIPRKQIETHSANMHLIPSDREVLGRIKDVRTGDVVYFSGYLVQAAGADGWRWRSSLSRNDTGSGACEVIYVEKFDIR